MLSFYLDATKLNKPFGYCLIHFGSFRFRVVPIADYVLLFVVQFVLDYAEARFKCFDSLEKFCIQPTTEVHAMVGG